MSAQSKTPVSLPDPRPVKPTVLDTVSTLLVGVLLGLGIATADRLAAQAPQAASGGVIGLASLPSTRRTGRRNWKQLLANTWREFNEDQIPTVAAGGAFYSLLAIFPALGAFVSLYGLFANVEDARKQIVALSGFMPSGAIDVLSDQMIRLAAAGHAGLGFTFLFSLIFSMWSANAGIKSVISGLNVAYEEEEHRNFLVLNLTSLGFTVGMTLFATVAVGALAAAPDLLTRIGVPGAGALGFLRWPALFSAVLGFSALLYRYGPSRDRTLTNHRPWFTVGGVLAAVGWMIMSSLFSTYVAHFGAYNKTYGSLGAGVGFMTWIWLSLMVILFGGELNREREKQDGIAAS